MIQIGKDDAAKVLAMGEGEVMKKYVEWKGNKNFQKEFKSFQSYLYA
jgi:hypothetical protein